MSDYINYIECESKLRRETPKFNLLMKDVRRGEMVIGGGKEDISSFRTCFICDPNASNPTKPIYGLYKILPKNLKGEDFIGMVVGCGNKNSSTGALENYATSIVNYAYYSDVSAYENMPPYIELGLSDPDMDSFGLIYIPATGYFGTVPLLCPMLLDLGCIEYEGTSSSISLDIKPEITVSKLKEILEDERNMVSIIAYEDGFLSRQYGSANSTDNGLTISFGPSMHNVTVTLGNDGSVSVTGDAGWRDVAIFMEVHIMGG